MVAVATPFTTLTLSGLVLPVSFPLSFIVTPFTLNMRFPSFTLLPFVSVTVALMMSFSPITPVIGFTVVLVFILFLTVILMVFVLLLYLLSPVYVAVMFCVSTFVGV